MQDRRRVFGKLARMQISPGVAPLESPPAESPRRLCLRPKAAKPSIGAIRRARVFRYNPHPMSRIRLLPRTTVEKIAAGEVVERPASVVKELVENALDAGATRITVEIEEGGRKTIRVIDDGRGIDGDDLAMAVTSHATSKIQDVDDLFRVATFGFRGEALAAIGSVSRLTLSSCTASGSGHAIEVAGGEAAPVRETGVPVGTRVEVHDLFYNVPARRKFLKTARTEAAYVQEWIHRFALAHPQVAFFLQADGHQAVRAFPAATVMERIRFLFGPETESELVPVDHFDGDFTLTGAVSKPSVHRPNAKDQMLFVNGRFVRDRTVSAALRQAYETLVPRGKYPAAYLFLTVPPDAVDVNVHPMKTEVRFRDAARIHPFIRGAVARALRPGPRAAFPETIAPRLTAAETRGVFGRERPVPPPAETGEIPAAPPSRFERQVRLDPAFLPEPELRFLQVHKTFLVVETEGGVEIYDQHALHERILYDELRSKSERAAVESQQLLIPEVLEFSPVEAAHILEAKTLLATLGFDVGLFGEGALAVHAAPSLLAGKRLKEFFRVLLERWGDDKTGDPGHLREKIVRIVACQAAVRAGDALSPEAVRSLLARRATAEFPGCCEHGRPTSFTMTIKDLEKRFLRR